MAIEIVDLPIKMVIFYSYVSLPEGNNDDDWRMPRSVTSSGSWSRRQWNHGQFWGVHPIHFQTHPSIAYQVG